MKGLRKSKPKLPQLEAHERIFRSIKKLGLTEEDMLKLEDEIKPVEGAPFGLGWPHYRALLDVREDAERLWYQEKAQSEALSLRELGNAIRENLFYKILGRRPPKPPRLGRRRPAPHIKGEEFANDPSYQELLRKVKKVIDEAETKGVAIRHRRDDILSCSGCGAFEDVLSGEEDRRTFLSSGEETSKPFLVIDTKEITGYWTHGVRCITEYQYVCGVCGIHQSASFTGVFFETGHE